MPSIEIKTYRQRNAKLQKSNEQEKVMQMKFVLQKEEQAMLHSSFSPFFDTLRSLDFRSGLHFLMAILGLP